MEIVRDFLLESEQPSVRHYHPGEIRIGATIYDHSLIVTPTRVVPDWPPQTLDELDVTNLAWLLELEPRPEMIILGTGERQRFPRQEKLAALFEAGIGVEIMDTAAACRTWNIVLAEGRRAASALIIR
ncbi:MAG: Mth938-like domain-containing protein [Gammaproteobacteria bacterium]